MFFSVEKSFWTCQSMTMAPLSTTDFIIRLNAILVGTEDILGVVPMQELVGALQQQTAAQMCAAPVIVH
jgi:hypothetical protein